MTPLETCIYLAGYLEAASQPLTAEQLTQVKKLLDDTLTRATAPTPIAQPPGAAPDEQVRVMMMLKDGQDVLSLERGKRYCHIAVKLPLAESLRQIIGHEVTPL